MSENSEKEFAFGKENYKLFAISAVIVTIGYFLMAGGGTDDPNVFNYDELFSARRIIVAPIVVLIGLGLALYAIVKPSKNQK